MIIAIFLKLKSIRLIESYSKLFKISLIVIFNFSNKNDSTNHNCYFKKKINDYTNRNHENQIFTNRDTSEK